MKSMKSLLVALVLGALLALPPPPANAKPDGIEWLRDERVAFERARAEKRYVLLYLEAVWCHWCHVMDHDTYGDEKVRATMAAHYVPLRIDQDARPDLANRYREYGWPATIVFAADGSEIVKRRGFIAPGAFARLLEAIVADPSPEHAASLQEAPPPPRSGLAPEVSAELLRRHRATFDRALGGLATAQKFMDRDSVEYALAFSADPQEREIAVKTLDGARALIDPVWGGVYQYSTGGDWKHPHYEKLGVLQGEYLRVYSRAYAQLGQPAHLQAARDVRRYIDGFLAAPEGGYHASQDADPRPGEHGHHYFALDDAARRKAGMPRIDRNQYAREAGAIAEGLGAYYEATGDATALASARAALRWALKERRNSRGGFRHGEADDAYLADSLWMGRALLQMYRASGEREGRQHAAAAADYIDAEFRARAGYAAGARGTGPIAPVPQLDENIQLGRFANLLARYTGKEEHRAIAAHAFAWLAQPQVALGRVTDVGILHLDRELNTDPLHLTVVGPRGDPGTTALFAACLRVPGAYKRLDWWDRSEGPLPNPDVKYPTLKRPAAFVCTEQRCSTPITKPEDVALFLAETAAE